VLHYDKLSPESRGGDRLLRRADFHLGYRLSFLEAVKPGVLLDGGGSGRGLRVLIFGTWEGAAGMLVPVEERTFRRLFALQGVMVNALPHPCALSPRAYRLFEPRATLLEGRKKGFLDGELLWRFVALDAVTQEDLAGAVGMSREAVFDLLLEIDSVASVV
jgi:cleavage and polyadenylation specificity factor subunit 1